MGKGTEYENSRRERQAEIARGDRQSVRSRNNPRPELRLGPDALAEALDSRAVVKDVLERVAGGAVSKVTVLHDAESGDFAVALPVEQYLEFVTALVRDRGLGEIKPDGRVAPSDVTLGELGVEQVNPRDTWFPLPDYDPTRPIPE